MCIKERLDPQTERARNEISTGYLQTTLIERKAALEIFSSKVWMKQEPL